MAPKAKGLAKAKVVVGKDNAQSKAQCKSKAKAKGAPLDNDHGSGNQIVKDHLHMLKGLKGHKGVEHERMHKGQMAYMGDENRSVVQQVGTSVRTSRRWWRRPMQT